MPTKTKPLNGNDPDTQPEGLMSAKEQLADAPNWKKLGKRKTISIRHGVMLARNISPDDEAFNRLKAAGDARTEGFGSDCRTANSWIDEDGGLETRGDEKPRGQRKRLLQKVDIQAFASWAVLYLESAHMPDEFRALVVPQVRQTLTNEAHENGGWARTIRKLEERFPACRSGDAKKRLQSLAKVVLALVTTRHNFQLTDDGFALSGAAAALERMTAEAGFRPMSSDTVTEMLELAIELLGRKAVDAALDAAVSKKAQGHPG